MGAVLDYASVPDGDNPVAVPHGYEAMSDDDHGSPFANVAHVGLNDAFAFVIECTCRLIENQDAGMCGKGTGNRYSLALAS